MSINGTPTEKELERMRKVLQLQLEPHRAREIGYITEREREEVQALQQSLEGLSGLEALK